jgi:hypothetical protein
MELNELPPRNGVQRAYCDRCSSALDLVFERFHEHVSGIEINVEDVPKLACHSCGFRTLPDRTRFFIMYAHEQATKNSDLAFISKRKKIVEKFSFTDVPFQYDPDDHYYYPGLTRPWDKGFLTPVFFNRRVLSKYDGDPRYALLYASPTYGSILTETFSIPFGINRQSHLIMWLGDIAKLPTPEQYYLLSENRPSDHMIGSQFYDGQIECIYTAPPQEDLLFAARSEFHAASFKRFGAKLAHLDDEVLALAATLTRPVHDTAATRRAVSDILNKVHLESLNSGRIGQVLTNRGLASKGTGSLKRLQALLASVGNGENVDALMSPFYTLYDFRVAHSHLSSVEGAAGTMRTVTDRLGLGETASLLDIYDRLLSGMTLSYGRLTELLLAD